MSFDKGRRGERGGRGRDKRDGFGEDNLYGGSGGGFEERGGGAYRGGGGGGFGRFIKCQTSQRNRDRFFWLRCLVTQEGFASCHRIETP